MLVHHLKLMQTLKKILLNSHYLIRASLVLVNFFGNNIRDAPGGFVLILNIFREISRDMLKSPTLAVVA